MHVLPALRGALGAALLATIASSATWAAAPATLGVNLIKNPGAESGLASPDGSTLVDIPKWTNSGAVVVVAYGQPGGFPDSTSPGPGKRGAQFFSGGANNESSALTQRIKLSALKQEIDSGTLRYKLQGWLGGFASQQDHAVLKVEFLDAADQALASGQTATVTAEDRSSVTGMIKRVKNGAVPVGARSAIVTLLLARVSGSYNDGYADGLSLVLSAAAP